MSDSSEGDDVFVVDSSFSGSGNGGGSFPREDESTGEWLSEGQSHTSGSVAGDLHETGLQGAPHAAPPAVLVSTGTNTEEELSSAVAAKVQQSLEHLAASLTSALSHDGPRGQRNRRGASPVRPDRKRNREPAPWADTLETVRAMCSRRLDPPKEPLAADPNVGARCGEAVAQPLFDTPPPWLPPLQQVLSAVEEARRDATASHRADPRPEAVPAPVCWLIAREEGDRDADPTRPPRPLAADAQPERHPPADAVTITAEEQTTLSEAALVLRRENAKSVLDVYEELLRLRRQQRGVTLRAAQGAANALAGQHTLFELMLEQLSSGVRAAEESFRRRCAEGRASFAEDGDDVESAAPSIAVLQEEMRAIAQLRGKLAVLKREGARASAPALWADLPLGEPHPHGHGSAFDAFSEAQLAEGERLRSTARQLTRQLQEATGAAEEWRRRYEVAMARWGARDEGDRSAAGIRPEVFKAYRDRCRECFYRLSAILGGEIKELKGWCATLCVGGAKDPVVVDLSSGEVVSGTLPMGKSVVGEQAAVHEGAEAPSGAFLRQSPPPPPPPPPPPADGTAALTESPSSAAEVAEGPPGVPRVPSIPSSASLSSFREPTAPVEEDGASRAGELPSAPRSPAVRAATTDRPAPPPEGPHSPETAVNEREDGSTFVLVSSHERSSADAKLTVPFSNDGTFASTAATADEEGEGETATRGEPASFASAEALEEPAGQGDGGAVWP